MLKTIRPAIRGLETIPTQSERADPEKILSIQMIREHTKTDDVPSVLNAQLELYRQAAIEAAERYTGYLLAERQVVMDTVPLPRYSIVRPMPDYILHYTKYTFAKNTAFWLSSMGSSVTVVGVHVNQKTIRLPIDHLCMMDGCSGCEMKPYPAGQLTYYAGFSCEADIPALIKLGMLKYIAHTIMHAGDAMKEDLNNPAVDSGAVEIWRSFRPDIL